jgi:hypothetical protein
MKVLNNLYRAFKSWVFPGVWFVWHNIDGTIRLGDVEIPQDSGSTWIGITGIGRLAWCPPMELIYDTGRQQYRAVLKLVAGEIYKVYGDRLVVEATVSGEVIEMLPVA